MGGQLLTYTYHYVQSHSPVYEYPSTPPPAPKRRCAWAVVAGAISVVALLVAVVVSVAASRTGTAQKTLPFENLSAPVQVELDESGNVYVRDLHETRVLRMNADGSDQIELSFGSDAFVFEMAVSPGGDVYVVDRGERLMVLRAGRTGALEVDAGSLRSPTLSIDAIDVDANGNMWLVEGIEEEMFKLRPGALAWTKVADAPPDSLVSSLVMVDRHDAYGWVYDEDIDHRTLSRWIDNMWMPLPNSDFEGISGLAVGIDGAVYVTDAGEDAVLKLAEGSGTWSTLPFRGLSDPSGIAVAADGTVYVADTGNNRVVRLIQ